MFWKKKNNKSIPIGVHNFALSHDRVNPVHHLVRLSEPDKLHEADGVEQKSLCGKSVSYALSLVDSSDRLITFVNVEEENYSVCFNCAELAMKVFKKGKTEVSKK